MATKSKGFTIDDEETGRRYTTKGVNRKTDVKKPATEKRPASKKPTKKK